MLRVWRLFRVNQDEIHIVSRNGLMRIKKSHNNEYLLTSTGLWVRNYTKNAVPYEDINRLVHEADYPTMLENETSNSRQRLTWIDKERFNFPNILIVSDGYKWLENQQAIASLSVNKVCVIAVNRSLAKWRVKERSPSFYVVNNPYQECMSYMPKKLFPKCIASVRTNHKFVENYKGVKYRYMPVTDEVYAGLRSNECEWQIDDYRNPICASIALAWKFGVERLGMLCCDDSFDDDRPGSEKLPNGLYQYPQQRVAHDMIQGMLYWMRRADPSIEIADASSGAEYPQAHYIQPDGLAAFFEEGFDD